MISLFPQDLVPALSSPFVSWFTFTFWPLCWALEFLPSASQHYTGKFFGGEELCSVLTDSVPSVRCLHSIRAGASFMLYFAFWWAGPWICTSMFSLHFADTFACAAWSAKSHAQMQTLQRQSSPSPFPTTTTGRAVKCQSAILWELSAPLG